MINQYAEIESGIKIEIELLKEIKRIVYAILALMSLGLYILFRMGLELI